MSHIVPITPPDVNGSAGSGSFPSPDTQLARYRELVASNEADDESDDEIPHDSTFHIESVGDSLFGPAD